MGKSKPRAGTKNRTNPVSKPAKPPSDPELAAMRNDRILPVLKDLQSPELKTRSAAALAITNIIEDTKCRKLLLREQIVRILFEQTLTDSSLETRTAAWGILRNLVLEEEADFCIHLFRQDILTAIEGVVKSIIQTIESQDPQFSKLPKAQQIILWSLTCSVLSLLTSLSEAQDEIIEAICKLPTIVKFLFGLLSFRPASGEVDDETLSSLTVLTEDNKPLAHQIVGNRSWLETMIQIKDTGGYKAVAACGVLHNIFASMQWFDHNTPIEGMSDALLIPTLVEFMESGRVGSNSANGHVERSSPDQILQLALDITASIATSLQEALEHGNGHEKEFEGFGDKDDMSQDDEIVADGEELLQEEDDANNEMSDEQIDADMELVTGDDHEEEINSSEKLTLESLVRNATPKILLLARPAEGVPTGTDAIQSHALSALNNIAWTISSIDFSTGHLSSLRKFWTSLAQRIWNEIITPVLASNTADIDLASSITSIAWAVSRSVQGAINIKSEEPKKFMALYHASKGLDRVAVSAQATKTNSQENDGADAFQSLGVKCIGVLGSLARHPAPLEVNRESGIFLLTVLAALPDTPAADAVEALNQIFDIYADDSYAFDEAVFWSDGFYKHLEEIVPKAKKMAKAIDKRKFTELRARADEANLNLGRFLKYKRSERTNHTEGYKDTTI